MNDGLFQGRIAGYEKLSQLDFPHALSAILFYKGCNLRCPYCYNAALVVGDVPAVPADEIMAFLEKRKRVLDGIVFSGGECTLWGKHLKQDMQYVKSLGYNIKLDTNGSNPNFVKELIEEGLVDYVALDVKTHKADIGKFISRDTEKYCKNLATSIDMLKESRIIFETRTTVHPDITSEDDISLLCKELSEQFEIKKHALQFFFSGPETVDSTLNQNPRYFDVSKVNSYGIELELRNSEGNEKRA